jgi:aminoglycoside phosphotransferase (APT) family kinase protein
VTRLDLADGSTVVLKVPPVGTPLLAYEAGLAAAEADYLELVAAAAPEIPLPRLLDRGDGWLVMSFLPGTRLTDLGPADGAAVRRDLGAAVARLHQVTGPRFGYSGDRVHGSTWRETYLAMVDGLLADAARWQVPLPDVRAVVTAAAGALDVVTRPALLHFDLWDGNVLGGPDGLTGLVDGERWLCGDPLVDLVAPALGRRIEEEPDHPFLAGYGPVELDPRRLGLYRVHLAVLMLAEMPSRGMVGPQWAGRQDRLRRHLDRELAALRPPPG